jgi:hypothetical protein
MSFNEEAFIANYRRPGLTPQHALSALQEIFSAPDTYWESLRHRIQRAPATHYVNYMALEDF